MITAATRSAKLFAAMIVVSALVGAGAPAQAADAERCIRAAQCHGPLPQICEQCGNGKSACAHWACVHHKCVVQICPRPAH
jgi:hypothetical protein